jgi:glycosyltransferase involved in cell wall biosynthesis
VLIASKILVVAAYRHKLDQIAAQPGVDELVVVTPPAWREPGGRTIAFEPSPRSPAYDLRVEPIAFNGNYHLFYWPRLRRILRQVRPDLVHLDEEPYNLATALGTWQARRAGARTLFFTWQNLLRRYPPPFRWFEQGVLRASSYAIAGNQEALAVLRTKGYRGGASVIPQFGVDPDLFTPADQVPSGPPVIGFVSRLVEEKGVLVLLDALAGLPGDWRLHVLGTGPLEAQARQRVAELGFADRVHWESGVHSTEVPARLRSFAVLVQPSLTRPHWKEQFGRAMMEAMACGVPVVGSTSAEIPNVIGDGGVVVPEGDPTLLRTALGDLLANPTLRQTYGRRGRARVLACFTNEQIAVQTVAAYRQALATRDGASR